MKLYLRIVPYIFVFLSACKFSGNNQFKSAQELDNPFTFTYQLDNPDTLWHMPAVLHEISGLSCFGDSNLVAVQDEQARIYLLHVPLGKPINAYDFGDKGDYEGIATVGSTAWVLKSNGDLYCVENFQHPHRNVTRFKTSLTVANNPEGLAYDSISNALLIACKGMPGLKGGAKFEGFKAIYSFNLDKEKLDTVPRILIDLSAIEEFRASGAIRKFYIRAIKKAGLISDKIFFEPSGMAVHPHNQHLFVISHTAKLLLVLDRHGQIVYIHRLNPRLFNQPEGICFARDGTLYISNEGAEGVGDILKFNSY